MPRPALKSTGFARSNVSTEKSWHGQVAEYLDLIRARMERTLWVDLRPLEQDLVDMLRLAGDSATSEELVLALREARCAARAAGAVLDVVDRLQRRGGGAVA
jgi:hypothetical protein